jgi:fructosamine-3-kinase
MTLLFGGFDASFYESYEEAYPLAPGWRERVGLFHLYPLLVHLLLFGGAYRSRVSETLSDWK